MKNDLRFGVLIPAILVLSACGGGGGGVSSIPVPPTSGPTPSPTPAPVPTPTPSPTPTPTPVPTPTPTPTPPSVNTDLLGTLVSESFTNDAVTASGSVPTNGNAGTFTAGKASVTISYSAGDRSYTITTGGRSQTFRPSDISNSLSNQGVTVYVRTNGATSDALTLTKPGTSGRFTYQYVAGGYWERSVTGTTSVQGSTEAFSYGVKTPDAAVPRSGQAKYDIDLLGSQTQGSTPFGITGQGALYVDFGRGSVVIQGEMDNQAPQPTVFSGEGTLSSSANGFSGKFRLDAVFGLIGEFNGRFYGPGGQEVGAAWYVKDTGGHVAVGTIIGRRDNAATLVNTDLNNLVNSQFFQNDGAILNARYTGGTATTTGKSTEKLPFIVHYNALYNAYTIVAKDQSQFFGPDRANTGSSPDSFLTKSFGTQTDELKLYDKGTYVGSAAFLQTIGVGQDTQRRVNHFVYGLPTVNTDLVRTGTGIYATRIVGSMTDQRYDNILLMSGNGVFTANLATGAIELNGGFSLEYRPITGPQNVGSGTYSGTGMISSSANLFSGSLIFDAFDRYTGQFTGKFYGPKGEELGAIFDAKDGDGDVAVGSIIGTSDPSALASFTPYGDLNNITNFLSSRSTAGYAYDRSSDRYFEQRSGLLGITTLPQIVYNPQTEKYIIREFNSPPGEMLVDVYDFDSLDKSAADTNAEFNVFKWTDGNSSFMAKQFRPAANNPRLVLTYASFVDFGVNVFDPGANRDNFSRSYYAAGVPTAPSLVPRGGTASYTGLAYGYGVRNGIGFNEYDIKGTSKLMVDFATSDASLNLNLTGTDIANASQFNFGAFTFNGSLANLDIGGSLFKSILLGLDGTNLPAGADGGATGFFYGPKAEEFVTPFHIYTNDNGDVTSISGVAIGKKN